MKKITCGNCAESFDTVAELTRHDCSVMGVDRYGKVIKKCINCHERYSLPQNQANDTHECKEVISLHGSHVGHVSQCKKCGLTYSESMRGVNNHICPSSDLPTKEIIEMFKVNNDRNIDAENNPISPNHYKSSQAKCPCGKTIWCIDVVRWFNMNLGNVVKYIWRCDLKGNRQEQLKKAHWYLRDEIRKQEPDFDANS